MAKLGEQQYVDLLRKIHEKGIHRPVKQKSTVTNEPLTAKTLSGQHLRFKPEHGMPLTTLRNMRGAFYMFVGEMLWILSGHTDLENLQKYNVHYWDEWATAERAGWYDLPEGQFGRTYGAQWRSFNAGGPEPIDQIKRLFTVIEKNPNDRGLLVNPWNPYDVDHIVIKPCHGTFRLLLMEDRWDMVVTQRSSDVPLGLPSNVVMYKFLQMLICMKTGFKEGDLIYDIHDAHYYSDQEKGIEVLLEREVRPYPTVTIDPIMVKVLDAMLDGNDDPLADKKFNPESKPYMDLLKDWIKLEGYNPQAPIPRELLPVDI
jgi:thymidylate synthase